MARRPTPTSQLFDLVTLVLASASVLRFWWAYLGLQDAGLLGVAAFASLAEAVRRVLVARRNGQRPSVFFSDRRSDLLGAILLGTGPWPILPSLAPALALPSVSLAMWVQLLVGTGVIAFSSKRLIAAVDDLSTGHVHQSAIRQLIAVPDAHMASLFLLPTTAAR